MMRMPVLGSPYTSEKHGGTESNLSITYKKVPPIWDGIPLVWDMRTIILAYHLDFVTKSSKWCTN